MKAIDRLYEYFELKSIKPTSFEKQIGLSNGYLGTQKKRNADIGEAIIIKIINNCLDMSLSWLLTGEGNMLVDKNDIAIPAKSGGIPLIPLSAMAGTFTNDVSVMEYECERYVIPMFKGADFLIPVKGSSMYPKYNSGDVVACQKVSMTNIFFQWNKAYVIDTTQGPLIKRIRKGSDTDHVLIVSDNDKYEPFELHLSQIHGVAVVLGVIRLE